MRHVVDEDGAGATLGTVAPQLGAGEAQLVAQRPGQRLLLHRVHSPLLAVYVEGDQPLSHTSRRWLAQKRRGAKEVVRRGDCYTAADHPFDEVASRNAFQRVFGCLVVLSV